MKKCAALNRVYRVIWNRARGVWIMASEVADGPGKGPGKGSRSPGLSLKGLLIFASLSLFSPLAMAAPTGGRVVSGFGTISQSGSTTTIQQASQKLSVNHSAAMIMKSVMVGRHLASRRGNVSSAG